MGSLGCFLVDGGVGGRSSVGCDGYLCHEKPVVVVVV